MSWDFWTECLILLLVPYPTKNNVVSAAFTMMTENWVDNSGAYSAHTHTYNTAYFTSDIMLVLMFSRLFILTGAILQQFTVIDFQGKRICLEANIKPNMFLLFRALMTNKPIYSLMVLTGLSLFFFGYAGCIAERPYYEFDLSTPQLDFSSFGSSAYWAIITMTSVGYGDIVPSTKIGRFLACMAAIWGAFMMSLVVTIISMALFLTDSDKQTLDQFEERNKAAKVVIAGMNFNMVSRRRLRALNSGDVEAINHAPSQEKRSELRNELWALCKDYRDYRNGDSQAAGSQLDQMQSEITDLSGQVRTLSAKLAILACEFHKSEKITITVPEDVSKNENYDAIKLLNDAATAQNDYYIKEKEKEDNLASHRGVLSKMSTNMKRSSTGEGQSFARAVTLAAEKKKGGNIQNEDSD